MKLGESKEDYLEAMYILKRQKGYVRNFLLCNYLNYSKASVSVIWFGVCYYRVGKEQQGKECMEYVIAHGNTLDCKKEAQKYIGM